MVRPVKYIDIEKQTLKDKQMTLDLYALSRKDFENCHLGEENLTVS